MEKKEKENNNMKYIGGEKKGKNNIKLNIEKETEYVNGPP